MLATYYKFQEEAGTDEAGRGCLAGPVTAAAVILPKEFKNTLLNDSKLMSASNRTLLKTIIEEESISYGVAHVEPGLIDEVNILNASIMAMHRAIDQLSKVPPHIIVDGNKFKPYASVTSTCIIKGDSKFLSIAAASVLAKTYRDAYMEQIHHEFPMYNWKKNKGYPTKEHREAIKKYGTSPFHRKSFRLLPDQLTLDL